MASMDRRNTPQGPRWKVRWWANGKQHSKTFTDEGSAKRFKAVLEGDQANGTFIDPRNGSTTVEEFAKEWFDNIVDLRLSTKSRLKTVVYQHIIPEFGKLPLSAVTNVQVTRWVAQSKVGPSSTRKNLFALRRLLQAAVDQQKIKTNVAWSVRVPAEPKFEQRFLTAEEVQTLSTHVDPRFRAMISVAVYGGLRFGELGALKRKNIDLTKGTVTIRETLVDVDNRVSFGPPKTKTSFRTVTLPRRVVILLADHVNRYTEHDDDLVFTMGNGSPLRRAWFRKTYWMPATESAGLEGLRFHDLRHTFVALWISLGRNAKEVSKVAGHSSVAFTLDRYGHLYETDEDDLADRLDGML